MNYNKKVREFLIGEFQKMMDLFMLKREFLVPFWTNILGYVQNISNSNEILQTYLKEQQEKTLKKMMILSCGKETAQKYNFDHRRYIKDRMESLNFLAIDETSV